MAQQIFETLPTGQRRVVSETPQPTAAPVSPFDQNSQPGLGSVAAKVGRNAQPQVQQDPFGSMLNPMNFPGMDAAWQQRLSDPKISDQQLLMLMMMLKHGQDKGAPK